jgi:hypothetical protein
MTLVFMYFDQVDISDMQNRLMKYAKLHTPVATPAPSP